MKNPVKSSLCIKYSTKILSCFLVFFSVFSLSARAAELVFDANIKELNIDQEFRVDVLLDTEGEAINAVEGTIFFPVEYLLFKDVSDGNSIINFWIERPGLKTQETIAFSGITPGGYTGSHGVLFSLVFKANQAGSGVMEFRDGRALKNDGLGTPAGIDVKNFPFSISVKYGEPQEISINKDDTPPEKFKPEIAQNPNLFEGKLFLVFAAQDKDVGISHYEVSEGRAEFIVARSPYLLKNQKLDKKIFVKAVDKNGNERVAVLYPPNFRPWYKNYWILGILVICAVFIVYIVRKKYGYGL